VAGRVWFILHSVRTEERSVTMLAIGVSGLHQNRREEVLHLPLSLKKVQKEPSVKCCVAQSRIGLYFYWLDIDMREGDPL
jgi:hypothetical protein